MSTTTSRSSPQLTAEQIWQAVAKASFAVVSHVTPSGAPRSSGVLFTTIDRTLYVVTSRSSWKARHIAADGRVAVTVPVRRGGILTLLFPIPPATVSFAATATVLTADSDEASPVLDRLGAMLPPDSHGTSSILQIRPHGQFVTYGIGVPLMQMRDPQRARARVPVTPSP